MRYFVISIVAAGEVWTRFTTRAAANTYFDSIPNAWVIAMDAGMGLIEVR